MTEYKILTIATAISIIGIVIVYARVRSWDDGNTRIEPPSSTFEVWTREDLYK